MFAHRGHGPRRATVADHDHRGSAGCVRDFRPDIFFQNRGHSFVVRGTGINQLGRHANAKPGKFGFQRGDLRRQEIGQGAAGPKEKRYDQEIAFAGFQPAGQRVGQELSRLSVELIRRHGGGVQQRDRHDGLAQGFAQSRSDGAQA